MTVTQMINKAYKLGYRKFNILTTLSEDIDMKLWFMGSREQIFKDDDIRNLDVVKFGEAYGANRTKVLEIYV